MCWSALFFCSAQLGLNEADQKKLSFYSTERYDAIYPEEDKINITAAPEH